MKKQRIKIPTTQKIVDLVPYIKQKWYPHGGSISGTFAKVLGQRE